MTEAFNLNKVRIEIEKGLVEQISSLKQNMMTELVTYIERITNEQISNPPQVTPPVKKQDDEFIATIRGE